MTALVLRSVEVRAGHAVDRSLGAVSGLLLANASRHAARVGFDRTVAVVSFDCDTTEDAAVVLDVDARMATLGIRPVYAVPGELLERAPDVYRQLVDRGSELLNHGHRQHCVFEPTTRSYESSYFYDQLSDDEVELDVRTGHERVIDVLGRPPTGFRVPHFGTLRDRRRRRRLHGLLAALGYRFSSSTMPVDGYLRGPVIPAGRVVELPVSGCPDAPRQVLDSWGFRFAPGRRWDEADYLVQVRKLIALHHGGARPGLLNLYADPSQVADWPTFFQAMALVAPLARPSFESVLEMLGQ